MHAKKYYKHWKSHHDGRAIGQKSQLILKNVQLKTINHFYYREKTDFTIFKRRNEYPYFLQNMYKTSQKRTRWDCTKCN